MKLASFDIFDTTLLRLYGRPESINVLLAGKEHTQGDAIEQQVERENLFANPAIRDLIRRKRQEGWQIAFISDMYLSSAFLTEILQREGCYEPGDKVYVSCEHNARKDTGTLYDLVRQELQPDTWEHYGDNKQSDVRMAEQKGIVAHHVEMACRDLAARFVAPAYVPYVLWLLSEARKQQIERLYFISRDGYILQQIAEALPHEGIELHYFFASRKALQLAFENPDARTRTMQYFRQEGLMDGARCAMVDVGWLGTSRKMINQLLRNESAQPVHFFYFGTTNSVLPEEYGTYQAYLPQGYLPYYMQLLVEHYFSASPYPSTMRYAQDAQGRIVPVFQDGQDFQETEITQTNTEVCLQMVESFRRSGTPSSEVLYQWAVGSLHKLAHEFFYADFTPLMRLPQFDGQDFVRRLAWQELLLMATTGKHITVFDKGSLAMTIRHLRVQKWIGKMHCLTGRIRSKIYQFFMA